MDLIFILMIFGGLGIAGYAIVSGRKNAVEAGPQRSQLSAADPLADRANGSDREFWLLKAGDLVKQITGTDFLVRRTVVLNDSGYQWNEHLLDDAAGNRKWLSVEDDEGLDLALWEPVAEGDIDNGAPGDKSVEARGMSFKLQESGSASYEYASSSGQVQRGSIEYFQYESPEGKLMALQNYDGGKWEASLGDRVVASDFEIYPSSDGPSVEGR